MLFNFIIKSFFAVLMYLFADIIFIEMLIRSAKALHNSMLYSIFRSRMSFFEQTPVGRIINRFSKVKYICFFNNLSNIYVFQDIEAIESNIPESYKTLLRCIIHVLSTIIVISISTPIFLVPLVPMAIIYIVCQVKITFKNLTSAY